MTTDTIRCRHCGATILLPAPGWAHVWAPRGARLQCQTCAEDLGPLSRVLRYLERKAVPA